MGHGVVSLSHVEDMGGGIYGVYFGCYGEGEFFAASDCYLRPEQAAAKYPGRVVHTGYAVIDTHGTGVMSDEKLAELVNRCFDLRPASIISMLDLRRPIYRQTAAFGHFGRTDIDLPWERIDRVEQLKAEAAKLA